MDILLEKTRDIVKKYDDTIKIIGKQRDRNTGTISIPDTNSDEKGWLFKQKEMIEQINFMRASRFRNGNKDEYGQRRSYANITIPAVFNAQKQMDVDTKQYRFIPDTPRDYDKVWLMSRQFEVWSRKNQWGKMLDDFMDDFAWYGTVVEKLTKNGIEKVNLNSLINLQDADSLRESIEKGAAVVQVHEMNKVQMEKDFPKWNLDIMGNKKPTENVKVYETYCMIPVSELKEYNGEKYTEADEENYTLVMAFVLLDGGMINSMDNVFYVQKIKDIPYIEAHFSRWPGRWLGIGVAELMLEAQVAKNLNVNLRQRAMLWGATKLFQTASSNDSVKNLRMQTMDGAILEVGPNGAISQIDTRSQHTQDFQIDDQSWEDIGRRNTFTFESVTGEAAKSGTPFRLGVLQTNNTNLFFDKKRDLFGFFLKEVFFKHQVEIFKRENRKEHILKIASYEHGAERIRNLFVNYKVQEALNKRIDSMITDLENSVLPSISLDVDAERLLIEEEFTRSPYMYLKMPEGIYDDLVYEMELDITGESVDLNQKIESLSTYYQALLQLGDIEKANMVLRRLMILSGNDTASLGTPVQENKAPEAIQQLQNAEKDLQVPNITNDALGQIQTTV